ncbi:MAG: bifunctional phosphopantothenoylcysteine decarboxylase/phosphopantothenate--cysteine ligase CoaBC [Anaerolineae bacterium]|nr:bifunctional phosphopantothenoylcysteine decarboxylase/phosphopantothenate--cysteine ligase CoaBC [Anaerolineae bacterium]
MMNLNGRSIILGVTGSIAAYKAVVLASRLTQAGAKVDVILTEAAIRFVAPLSFEAVTGRPAYTSLWHTDTFGGMGTHIAHVALAHQADLLAIAPITANTIAKIALGLADDLLSVTALAASCPVLIAPAMDAGMYENPATQGHIETLRGRGMTIAGPTVGRMASGLEGLGRMIEPEEIVGYCRVALGRATGSLRDRRIVVSAGPTREAIDPVRYISNHSSGKQGFAVAQAALDAGAEVTLISGPVSLPVPVGAQVIRVEDARAMHDAVLEHSAGADALVMSAAVADYRPVQAAGQKIKKDYDEAGRAAEMQLALTPNPDILYDLSRSAQRPHLTIGFAAETQALIANAQSKLARKGLDMIVANDVTAPDAGFAVDTNRVHFITPGGIEDLPLLGKDEVAVRIVTWIGEELHRRGNR